MLKSHAAVGAYRNTVWLFGDGRSGTTWVARLINHTGRLRELFEPFHPSIVERVGFLRDQHYAAPEEDFPELQAVCRDLFAGWMTHWRVDRDTAMGIYRGLLIKDIFANLLAAWAIDRFPRVRPVLLVRNPFAVGLSKRKAPTGHWAERPAELLEQASLVRDHLGPFSETLQRVDREGDFLQRQIAIWSAIHYVPFRQFRDRGLTVVFYEDFLADPVGATRRLIERLSLSDHFDSSRLNEDYIGKPTFVSGPGSNLILGKSPLDSWKDELSSEEIAAGWDILAEFGLDELYTKQGRPNHAAAQRLGLDLCL